MNSSVRVALAALTLTTVLATACDDGPAGALEASGTIEATETDLGFQIPGRLAGVGPPEGDRVSAGDTLATLEAEELEAAVAAASAALATAEAGLAELRRGPRAQEIASARAALDAARQREDEARREAERARRLHEGGAVSQRDLDRATTAAQTATAAREQAEQALGLAEEGASAEQLAAQRARVEQAAAGVAQARAAARRTVLLAPAGGIVTVRHREPGEIVSPGLPVLTVMDPSERWVRIYVREDRVGRVSLGQAAEVRIDAFPDEVFRGSVVFIGSEAEFTPRNVQTPDERTQLVYPVKVRIEGDEALRLKPGLPADVRLEAAAG